MAKQRLKDWGIWGLIFIVGVFLFFGGIIRLVEVFFYRNYLSPTSKHVCEIPLGITLIIIGIALTIFSYRKAIEHSLKSVKLEMEAVNARKKSQDIPKVYSYYCPNCLYQTNEKSIRCPRCKEGRLRKTE